MSRAARRPKRGRDARHRKGSPPAPTAGSIDSAAALSAHSPPQTPEPRRPLLWPLLLLVVIQGVYLGTVGLVVFLSHTPATMLARDALALPGGPATGGSVEIGVQLVREPLPLVGPGVGGVEVEFFSAVPGEPEQSVGSAVTTPDGVAATSVKVPEKAGNYRFLARLPQPESLPLSSNEEAVLLAVVPADHPLLLVPVPEAVSPGLGTSAQPRSLETLWQLASSRAVVYVATTGSEPLSRRRVWLERSAFPPGPVLNLPVTSEARTGRGAEPQAFGEFLKRQDLSSRWDGDLWGVTRSRRNASALAFAGFRVALLGLEASGLEADDRTIFAVSSWEEARKKIEDRS